METQQYRVTRTNPGINFSIPCGGGIDFWPINTSYNCSGLTMYQSTGSQIRNAIDYDMDNFPVELRDCSPTNPCVVLWDIIPTSIQSECNNIGGYSYKKFRGLQLTLNGILTNQSYNEFVPAVYDINNLTTSMSLPAQNAGGYFSPIISPCGCNNEYLNEDLYKLTTLLTQDINDIGHYTIWDGNIAQKEVFANFVYSGAPNGLEIKLYNTTDFGYYSSLQDSEYIINWGDGTALQTLQYPTLYKTHTYPTLAYKQQYTITINHQTPWGPVSSSKVVNIPYRDYIALIVEGYTESVPPSMTGGTGIGPQQFIYTYTPIGTTASTTSVAYHSMYPSSPLDSGTHINQYTAMSPTLCFTVSGVTTSMLGSFKQYTGATNSAFLPGGYMENVTVSIAGDVLDPITNNFVPGVQGEIISASLSYTAYTLYSSVNHQTPIEFYDFPDGITIFVAESCGLNALAFGDDGCYECPQDTCEWCLTKDEYVDRVTGVALATPSPIGPPMAGLWNNYTDYYAGDIVFDKTFHDCCCYMALVNIAQTGILSDFAGRAPALTEEGVFEYSTGPQTGTRVHIWEACSPDCVSCPAQSMTPCQDLSITSAMWDSGTTYNVDDYVQTLNGCYQALASSTDQDPSDILSAALWEYVGCVHWACPIDPATVGCVRVPGIGGPQTFMMWADCETELALGNCFLPRYYCASQYDCGGCNVITALDMPEWGQLGVVSFETIGECLTHCKPPIWVCDDKTTAPCCEMVTCNNQSSSYLTINNAGSCTSQKGPGPYNYDTLTTTGTLDCDFYLTKSGCTTDCCDFTRYDWNCELGCYPVYGTSTPWANLAECQSQTFGTFITYGPTTHTYRWESNTWLAANSQQMNVCGWDCVLTNTPCIPIFVTTGTTFSDPFTCEQNCSAATPCVLCNCGINTECQLWVPCITIASHYGGSGSITDPANWITDSFVGPDPVNKNGGGKSFVDQATCDTNCECIEGWDCWIDIHATSQNNGIPTSIGYCANYTSIDIQEGYVSLSGLTPSTGGPYDTHEECCTATTCCMAICDSFWPPGWSGALPPPLGNWPCSYIMGFGSVGVDVYGDPITACTTSWDPFVPFCTMDDCQQAVLSTPQAGGNPYCAAGVYAGGNIITPGVANNAGISGSYDDWCLTCPGSGITWSETCVCACELFANGLNNIDHGAWNSGYPFFTYGDVTSYLDGNNPLCCYYCGCYSADTFNPLVTEFGVDRLCGIHSPGDGATFLAPDGTNTIVNCWQTCDKMPSGTTSTNNTGCTQCGAGPTAPSYSCGGGEDYNLLPCQGDPACLAVSTTQSGGYLGGCVANQQGMAQFGCVIPYDSNNTIEIELQTAANCFSDSQCHLKCMAGCFCEAGGNPYTAGTSMCVTSQQYDANVLADPNAYGNYTPSMMNFLIGNLGGCNIVVNAGTYDCCGNPRYNCLSGVTCSEDPAVLANQTANMNYTVDACVPLWPTDIGYGTAQFRDEWATATTITLCPTGGGPATTSFLDSANHTAAYNMCSYYCRWSCDNHLPSEPEHCHFVGNYPSELAQVYHPMYNQTSVINGGCVTSSMYTSAVDCYQGGATTSCWCNEDWYECSVVSDTQTISSWYSGIHPATGAPTQDVVNTTSCNCVVSATGIYHTLDECENPQNYTNVQSSCCDGSIAAWCLAISGELPGACDNTNVLNDPELLLPNTTQGINVVSSLTDWTTNTSGLPGDILRQEYSITDLSPNMMYSLQTQITEIVNQPMNVYDLDTAFESVGLVATVGTECVSPNIPMDYFWGPDPYTGVPGFTYQSSMFLYGWFPNDSDPWGPCCVTVNGTEFIKQRVRSISHEYLIHADLHLLAIPGSLYKDSLYLGYDYSSISNLLKAATEIGVTGLTSPNLKTGWAPCSACTQVNVGNVSTSGDPFFLTDIHEISHQISKQYYERIYPGENAGATPPWCLTGEQWRPFTSSTTTAATYMSCVTLKTRNCCDQPCFCTDDTQAFTWLAGSPYTSLYDPQLSTGGAGDVLANMAPFVIDFIEFSTQGGGDTDGDGIGPNTEAYGDGFYSNYDCNTSPTNCCGQNTGGLIYGCTDKQAFNFDCKATTVPFGPPCGEGINIDDGSCVYFQCIWGVL